jgi:Fe-S-cluster containining protein
VNGRCQFLGEDDRCTIYEDRPAACRAFGCIADFNRDGIGAHGTFLRRNAPVLAMLENL